MAVIEFNSKKYVEQVTKTEINTTILEKPTFLHFHYSRGYDYYIKFNPSSYEINGNNFYKLEFIYMRNNLILKDEIRINPFDRFHSLEYLSDEKEFKYIGQKNIHLPQDYYTIIANYWLLQKRLDDCFFKVINEDEFNLAKEKFFSI